MNIESYRGTYEFSFLSSPELIKELSSLDNVYTIIDKGVYDAYRDDLSCVLDKEHYVLEANENNKTIDVVKKVIEEIVLLKSRKETKIIAIGGGITQDVSCFVASILYRGVNWYFVPTTLLAQTDSCIGSKSSLNMIPYKNLLGTFYPPKKIFICTDFLKTLSEKEYFSGLGEIAKCALLSGEENFNEFANDLDNILTKNYSLLKKEIKRTLIYKKGLIEVDEFDIGVRNILNYGHTFGHAIESVSGYLIPHGQAVSIGLLVANNVSLQRGYMTKEHARFIHNTIVKILNFNLISKEVFNPPDIIMAMKGDKKYSEHHNCILIGAEKPGKYPVLESEITEALLRTYDSLAG